MQDAFGVDRPDLVAKGLASAMKGKSAMDFSGDFARLKIAAHNVGHSPAARAGQPTSGRGMGNELRGFKQRNAMRNGLIDPKRKVASAHARTQARRDAIAKPKSNGPAW